MKDGEYFKKGDLFISIAHANMVILFDTKKRKIKWHTQHTLFHQHDVDILDGEKISIFNNNRIHTSHNMVDGVNQILSFNFKTNEYQTLNDDLFKMHDIRTVSQGLHGYIDNNFFVEETNWGRFLLFDEAGKVIFSYISLDEETKGNHMLGWSSIVYDEFLLEKMRYEFGH